MKAAKEPCKWTEHEFDEDYLVLGNCSGAVGCRYEERHCKKCGWYVMKCGCGWSTGVYRRPVVSRRRKRS